MAGSSQGGLTVSKMQHSLTDKSVRATTVLSSWAAMPGTIPCSKIIAAFNAKSKQPKGKEAARPHVGEASEVDMTDAETNVIIVE
jgi:hypothetical protein